MVAEAVGLPFCKAATLDKLSEGALRYAAEKSQPACIVREIFRCTTYASLAIPLVENLHLPRRDVLAAIADDITSRGERVAHLFSGLYETLGELFGFHHELSLVWLGVTDDTAQILRAALDLLRSPEA